ncbi:DUF4082 domain-containing protein [Blastococcus deserti]|uniref:DUF4082 domain-containing protein n=1 Tax=Blastococcus deserti TaxID=2259033 RepID=A0ABW4XAQ8_9ACTN
MQARHALGRLAQRGLVTIVIALLAATGMALVPSPARAAGPCDPPVNPIVCENSKPGSPQADWRVDGYYGDIMGFGAATSVQPGEKLPFKVLTPATAYHIDIFRLGWYGGDGARLITQLTPSARLPQSQPDCLYDGSTGMTDCGNWAVSATWTVPTSAVSGYYVANFIRDDVSGASQFPFIVRNDASTSDLLIQASDSTWQAYNKYGGNSVYESNFPGSSDGRAYKVSYNRPYLNTGTASFMNAELPLLRWVERNGYDVSYISATDTTRDGSLLLRHKTFISSGHDEYWAGAQRTNVENARAAGVNLAFFSGNEMFWKTRYEPSISADKTPYRTLVTYKETKAGAKIDPSPEWTGTWRDPRLSPPSDGGRPENALTGTLFRVNGYTKDAITVGSQFSALRFWRNTSVADLAVGRSETLLLGSLGYEWDEDPDNGFRPAGSIQMSRTTMTRDDGLVLLDHGNTYGNGTASHSLVLYRASSGALVFGAGTVQWSWGLDEVHLYPGPGTDRDMQQATVNLFADMGAQPATLQSGLVRATETTDTSGPTATITSPTSSAAVPALAEQVVTGTARDTGGVVAAVEVSVDGGRTYTRATPTGPNGSWSTWSYSWTPQAPGSATVSARASDDSANLGPVTSTTVTVSAEICPCTLFGKTTPGHVDSLDTGTVELGTRFTSAEAGQVTGIRFYKSLANTGPHTGSLWTGTGQLLATGTFSNETASGWQTLTLASPVTITAGTSYVVSYKTTTGHYSADAGYFTGKGAGGSPLTAPASTAAAPNGLYVYGGGFPINSYNDTNYWVDVVFSPSQGGADITPPAVITTSPAASATGVDVGASVTAGFSEPVSATGLQFTLTPAGGAAVGGSSTVSADGVTATFTPAAPLSASTTYTASLRATDTAGNAMSAPVTWSFTTGTVPDPASTATVFGSATPTTAAAPDGSAVELGMRIVPSVNGRITGVRFYKSAGNTGTHTGSLWTTTGQRLATGTFLDETATGWQKLTFAAPVPVAAGQTYVVSYHTPSGNYAADQGYFTGKGAGRSPLIAPASTAGAGNGLFLYGTGGFPTGSYKDTNYWVDAVLDTTGATPDSQAPTVTGTSPASGATGVAPATTVVAEFSEPVASTGLTIGLTGPGGATVSGTTALSADGRAVTFTPATTLSPSATYTASVRATDPAGNTMAGPHTWTFTTGAASDSVPPAVTATTPAAGATDVALTGPVSAQMSEPLAAAGLEFTLTTAGGAPVAGAPSLSVDGLTATFTPGAALSGSTTYTASLRATDRAGNAMATPVTWSFTTAPPPDTTAPSVTGVAPADGATGVRATDSVTASFSEPVAAGSLQMGLTDPDGAVVAGTTVLAADGRSATFTPASALATATRFTASVRAADLAGNVAAAPRTWSFTTASGPDTTAPSVEATSPGTGATGVAPAGRVTVTFTEPVTAAGLQFTLTGPDGTAVAGAAAVSADGRTATFSPAAALVVSTRYEASVRAEDRSGNPMAAPALWSFTTASGACPCTVLGQATPSNPDSGDGNGVELGMRVVPSVNAVVTGVRFYKSVANTGTHTGSLWSSSGELLATGTFTGETARGWQTLTFATPVPVQAGVTYVASYLAPSGHYAADPGYFTGRSVSTGVLTAPAGSGTAGNGLYRYGGGFPTDSHNDANYYVDVVVTTEGADTTPPTVTTRAPAPGATQVPLDGVVSVTFSEPVRVSALGVSLTGPDGAAVAGDLRLSEDGRTATLRPTSDLAPATGYTVAVRATDTFGNAMPVQTWSFATATAGAACPCSLFRPTDAPAATADEGTPVSLGMTWAPTVDGAVTAIRFHKVSGDTGTHTGTVFSIGGVPLATGTFTDETASGWQTLQLASPLPVTAGTSYVVAYSTSHGRFGYTRDYFSAPRTAGPLTAPASSATEFNGRYTYAEGSPFPVSSGGGANYWVDVVFAPAGPPPPPPDTTPPSVVASAPAAGATDVAPTTAVTATFSEPVDAGTLQFVLTGASGPVPAAAGLDAAGTGLTARTSSPLAPGSYAASVLAADRNGNAMPGPYTWTFVVPDTVAPGIAAVTPAGGSRDVAATAAPSATFDEPVRVDSILATLTSGGSTVPATTVVSGDRTVTVNPVVPLRAGTTYTVTLTGVTDLAGNVLTAPYSWSFTTAGPPPPVCPCSLFGPTDTAPRLATNSGAARELGMKFRATADGQIDAIRFYKSLGARGTHTGNLWSASGQRLAQVTFTAETSAGWQIARLSKPVPVTAGTVYVVSYTAPQGRWSETANYFAAEKANGPLRGLANGQSANGVYGAAGAFPITGGAGRNYWVDVVFTVRSP